MKNIISVVRREAFLRANIAATILLISGYIYLYCSFVCIIKVSLALFFISGLIVLWSIIRFLKFMNNVRKNTSAKYKVDQIPEEEFVEFIKLAKSMKVQLDSSYPFQKYRNFENIGVNITKFKWQILIGDKLFSIFDKNERIAVVAHELAHIKNHNLFIKLCTLIVISFIVYITVLISSNIIIITSISAVMIVTAAFMGFWIASYLCEYWADETAVSVTNNKTSYLLALRKSVTANNYNIDYESHPSIEKRIQRLNMKFS